VVPSGRRGRRERECSVVEDHAVPDARFRKDSAGLIRIQLELLAELTDVDAQILHVVGILRAPDGGQNGMVGEHAPGMRRQVGQKLVFYAGQLELFAVAGDLRSARSIVTGPAWTIRRVDPWAWAAWRNATRTLARSSSMPNGFVR